MKLVWRSAALADLRRLRAFISPKNPNAAVQAVQTIRASVKMLESFPNMGRPLDAKQDTFREWVVDFGAGTYVVRYRIKNSEVTIIGVRHGRETDSQP